MEENLRQQQTNIIKIALFGPESTGKTTLSQQLAEHFETVWIPEFAREYLQTKLKKFGTVCDPEDMLPIAIGQTKLENDILSIANKFLFCDTNLMVTKVYSEAYYNFCDPILDHAAKNHNYDLFFLTDIDMPWEKDDLRDSVENRDKFFDIFYNSLIENKKPFIKLSGTKENRLKKAISTINDLVKAKEMGFSSLDFVEIYNQGISLDSIDCQKKNFENGVLKTFIERPALLNDGILMLSDTEFIEKSEFFNTEKESLKLMKFVPASGAASRMFKFLNEFMIDFDFGNETINRYINRKNANDLTVFLAGLEKFPFFQKVDKFLNSKFLDFKTWDSDKKNHQFIESLVLNNVFDFANKPKAILPFHQYKNHIATPIEEHLNESACYATSNNISNLHFTVTENHQKQFEEILSKTKSTIEKESGSKINVNFSYQKTSTDTIAVDLKNNPLRNEHGDLIFRPGGHGALLENLNDLDADIIFIKNIDNVIQNHIEKISLYKMGLAGILVALQKQIFKFLDQIEEDQIHIKEVNEIIDFASKKLNIEIFDGFEKFTIENKISYVIEILNRPIRVCGMVKNEGEPGGGPFWVRDQRGTISLQIVETAQIDLHNLNQAQILKNSTHFNPVDLVCGIKNHKKQKFNLHDFVDHNSGFIVKKNKNGIDYKAYELPGLWNGAMSKWITIFVQVPLLTFNPVKTVNDLLKPAHQPNYTNFG